MFYDFVLGFKKVSKLAVNLRMSRGLYKYIDYS
jgi:hypothetical protein